MNALGEAISLVELQTKAAQEVANVLTGKAARNPVNDVTPIVLIDVAPALAAVHPSLPVASVSELIAYAKANPGKLTGTVRNLKSGATIANASINCGNGYTAKTSSKGLYSIANLAPARYTCTASATFLPLGVADSVESTEMVSNTLVR